MVSHIILSYTIKYHNQYIVHHEEGEKERKKERWTRLPPACTFQFTLCSPTILPASQRPTCFSLRGTTAIHTILALLVSAPRAPACLIMGAFPPPVHTSLPWSPHNYLDHTTASIRTLSANLSSSACTDARAVRCHCGDSPCRLYYLPPPPVATCVDSLPPSAFMPFGSRTT